MSRESQTSSSPQERARADAIAPDNLLTSAQFARWAGEGESWRRRRCQELSGKGANMSGFIRGRILKTGWEPGDRMEPTADEASKTDRQDSGAASASHVLETPRSSSPFARSRGFHRTPGSPVL